jgi:MFS family permease
LVLELRQKLDNKIVSKTASMGAEKDIEHDTRNQPTSATIEAARAQGLEVTSDGKIGNVAGHGQLATDAYGNPLVTFDKKEEERLRWKLDLFTVPTVFFLYLFCFIDRVNIGNARLANLQEDLGMTGKWDYNIVVSIFYISYIIFEIPATICCKWMGPGWFLPATTLGFGLVSICTGYVKTMEQLCGVRFLLGIFEAGMLPGVAYYLSRWYQRAELSFRLALYMVAAPLAGAFGALLASGILHMDSFAGVKEWRMIFVVEGIVTICLGVAAFGWVPAGSFPLPLLVSVSSVSAPAM